MKELHTVDLAFNQNIVRQVFSRINHGYFRAKLLNPDKVPPKTKGRPRIFFSNHSGMAFPWDSICFHTLFWEYNRFSPDNFNRVLGDPSLFTNKILSPYMIDNFWRRFGGVEAHLSTFEALMKEGESVFIYPEGVAGIGKGFARRYKIQKFSTSFIRMAIEFDAELIPVYTINAEFNLPFAERNNKLDSFAHKLGVPFIPLSPLTSLAMVFPWSYYFALPAKMHFVFGDPIDSKTLSGGKTIAELSRKELITIRDKVTTDFQINIDRNVSLYGKDPYCLNELYSQMLEDPIKSLYVLPFSWPILLKHCIKQFDIGNTKPLNYTLDEYIRICLQNMDGVSFALPFAWPLVLNQHPDFARELMDKALHLLEDEVEKMKAILDES
jgi:1-acyl-sn-glycerol-3-phosphate acyltransferase